MAVRRTRILIAVVAIWVLAWVYYSHHPTPLPSSLSSIGSNIGSVIPPQKPPGNRGGNSGAKHDDDDDDDGGTRRPLDKWSKRPVQFPPESQTSLPTVKSSGTLPRVQADRPHEDALAKEMRLQRLAAVKESFLHSWNGYKRSAWGRDEVRPLTGAARDTFGGWGATLVDTLDTLWIMGLTAEFEEAVEACRDIDFTSTSLSQINVFETTIRYLGGFLSAYEISEKRYPVLLGKAFEVADLLMSVFDTPNHMPVARWNWKDYVAGKEQKASTRTLIAEIGSLNMEFAKMSQLTGDMRFYDAVQRIMDGFERAQQHTFLPGMWPVAVDASETPLKFSGTTFTIGGMADSLYEYFPKQYLLLGGALAQPRRMYEGFIDVAKKHLLRRALNPDNLPISFFVDANVLRPTLSDEEIQVSPKGQHLTCFAGGMVGMASKIFDRPQDLAVAEQLTEGCIWSYNITQTGIGPETFTFVPCDPPSISLFFGGDDCKWTDKRWHQTLWRYWRARGFHSGATMPGDRNTPTQETVNTIMAAKALPTGLVDVNDRRYLLRPEAVESVFMMHRLTGDPKWGNAAWDMFSAIEKHARTPMASAGLEDVTRPNGPPPPEDEDEEGGGNHHPSPGKSAAKPNQIDSMESFWTAETLKYFYLIFSEWDVVDLDKWVLNTEAHPFLRADAVP